MNINNSNEQMTINTLQQLSQLTSTKISISIYSYKTQDIQNRNLISATDTINKFHIHIYISYACDLHGNQNLHTKFDHSLKFPGYSYLAIYVKHYYAIFIFSITQD